MKKLTFLVVILSLVSIVSYAGRKDKKEDKKEKEKPKKTVKRKEVADLEGTKWVLIEMNGKAVGNLNQVPHLVFTDKGDVLEGSTGCNQINGKYKEGKDGAIKLEAMTTKMACANMETESQIGSVLTYGNRYKINGQHLILYNDNLLLAIFEARYEE